jgi:hypothetical protein
LFSVFFFFFFFVNFYKKKTQTTATLGASKSKVAESKDYTIREAPWNSNGLEYTFTVFKFPFSMVTKLHLGIENSKYAKNLSSGPYGKVFLANDVTYHSEAGLYPKVALKLIRITNNEGDKIKEIFKVIREMSKTNPIAEIMETYWYGQRVYVVMVSYNNF